MSDYKRMTERTTIDGVDAVNIIIPGNDSPSTMEIAQACAFRLAEYEDTGWGPKEVPTALELVNVFGAMIKLKEYESTGLSPKQVAEMKCRMEGLINEAI